MAGYVRKVTAILEEKYYLLRANLRIRDASAAPS